MRMGALVSLLFLSVVATAADPCVSGPQLGQRPGPYSFLVATGPERGQPTCYVCETAEKPGVIVFARSLSEPLAKLMGACDNAVASRPKEAMRSWMTVLGEKTIGLDDLGKWATQSGLKAVPVGVFDDPVGPPSYRLASDADITVLVFENRKVLANFAFRKGELDETAVKKVAAEMVKLGGKK
ncbi:MAG TPA: hypothetical protein VHR66_02790 [Gemmataceae bacterium]|jgi:hypothetical protein|nr:hypothetical protein [Gemmataceae bacterium]